MGYPISFRSLNFIYSPPRTTPSPGNGVPALLQSRRRRPQLDDLGVEIVLLFASATAIVLRAMFSRRDRTCCCCCSSSFSSSSSVEEEEADEDDEDGVSSSMSLLLLLSSSSSASLEEEEEREEEEKFKAGEAEPGVL